MQTASKFTFDLNLSPKAETAPVIEIAEHKAALEQAREQGYQDGVEAGRTGVEAQAAEHLAQSSAQVMERCQVLLEKADSGIQNTQAQSIELALLVARKLAPGLIERQPMAEITALLENCLGDLQQTPHLAVRVHEDFSKELKITLDKLAYEKGYEGRVIVLGEPDITPGDGSIEWAEGGLSRSIENIENSINDNVAHFLAASSVEEKDEDLLILDD